MEKKELICIECPKGCRITVTLEEKAVLSIEGNECKRGALYASDEAICPRRVLTTTVRATDGRMVPVKTAAPIKKEEIFPTMEKIKALRVSCPVTIGQVVCHAISEDIDLVVTRDMK